MQLIKVSRDEAEIIGEIEKYYDKALATDMLKAVHRNGMCAWGQLMIRKSGKDFLVLKMPTFNESEGKANA